MFPPLPFRGHCWHSGYFIAEDYFIADNKVYMINKLYEDKRCWLFRRYDPTENTALPEALVKIEPGDTKALLGFIRTYGMLGYDHLAFEDHLASVGGWRDLDGEPLGWVWAHIATVRLCFALQELCDEQQESMRDLANTLRQEIIRRNTKDLMYISRCLDGNIKPRLDYNSLIYVIYAHMDTMADKPVKRCKHCRSPFLVRRSNQLFCSHPIDPSKPSLCAAKYRQARRRAAKRATAC